MGKSPKQNHLKSSSSNRTSLFWDSLRPSYFDVTYKIGSRKEISVSIKNQPGVRRMETRKMQDLYQLIGEKLNDIIPGEWTKIYLYAEVLDDSTMVLFISEHQKIIKLFIHKIYLAITT